MAPTELVSERDPTHISNILFFESSVPLCISHTFSLSATYFLKLHHSTSQISNALPLNTCHGILFPIFWIWAKSAGTIRLISYFHLFSWEHIRVKEGSVSILRSCQHSTCQWVLFFSHLIYNICTGMYQKFLIFLINWEFSENLKGLLYIFKEYLWWS